VVQRREKEMYQREHLIAKQFNERKLNPVMTEMVMDVTYN